MKEKLNNYRPSKGETEHYTSISEMARAYNISNVHEKLKTLKN
nr:MAG TPA: hypothetical protein [Caudoviricetes sp.]